MTMRRISSAPCISGLSQSVNTSAITVQPLTTLQTIPSLRTCPSSGSACGSASGSAIGAMPLPMPVDNITPYDMLVVQNVAPVSTISQCFYDQALKDIKNIASHDAKDLAMCVITPSHAPELASREPLSDRLQERHLAYVEVRLRSRARNKGQGQAPQLREQSSEEFPQFTPNDVY